MLTNPRTKREMMRGRIDYEECRESIDKRCDHDDVRFPCVAGFLAGMGKLCTITQLVGLGACP